MELRNWIEKDMDEQRLQAWFDGKLANDELTDSEVDWLASATFEAVSKKKMLCGYYDFYNGSTILPLN